MKILLTGGSGFIGRNLFEALGGRYEVFAPSHREFDVTDTAAVDRLFRERRFDAVLHAAVQGGNRVLETTLRGYWNLARQAGKVGHLFYFGSGAEYGKQRDLVIALAARNEDARRRPRVTNLRLFGVYGPHEGYLFRFISNSIVKTLLGMDIRVRQDVVFDYLQVADLVAIVERFLENEPDVSDLNVTPTESISLRQILAIISAVASRPLPVHFETEGLNFQYTGHNGTLQRLMPDLRFIPYEEGIHRLYSHYDERRGALDKDAVVRDDYLVRTRPRTPQEQTE